MSWKGGERSCRKDSLVGDEMVERKWFKFKLHGRQVVHFHMPHIKPLNPSFFFCLSQFQYADTISPYSSRFFLPQKTMEGLWEGV